MTFKDFADVCEGNPILDYICTNLACILFDRLPAEHESFIAVRRRVRELDQNHLRLQEAAS